MSNADHDTPLRAPTTESAGPWAWRRGFGLSGAEAALAGVALVAWLPSWWLQWTLAASFWRALLGA